MTCRGHIENGSVVFDEMVPLAEGTPVRIEPVAEPATTLAERFKDVIGCISDLPKEPTHEPPAGARE
jgi:hypothetical protein